MGQKHKRWVTAGYILFWIFIDLNFESWLFSFMEIFQIKLAFLQAYLLLLPVRFSYVLKKLLFNIRKI